MEESQSHVQLPSNYCTFQKRRCDILYLNNLHEHAGGWNADIVPACMISIG